MTPREVVTRAIEFRRPPRLRINGFGDRTDQIWVSHAEVKPPEAGDDPMVFRKSVTLGFNWRTT